MSKELINLLYAIILSVPITIVICAIIRMMDDIINPNKEDMDGQM